MIYKDFIGNLVLRDSNVLFKETIHNKVKYPFY